MKQRYALHDNWTLELLSNTNIPPNFVANRISASVPGCVHTDLLSHKLIPEPYVASNETLLQWIGENDWAYETSFEVSAETLNQEHLDLVCEGLDTVATLSLNGSIIGKSETMHIAHRFNAKPFLRLGTNSLRIQFHCALTYANEQVESLGYLPNSSLEVVYLLRQV